MINCLFNPNPNPNPSCAYCSEMAWWISSQLGHPVVLVTGHLSAEWQVSITSATYPTSNPRCILLTLVAPIARRWLDGFHPNLAIPNHFGPSWYVIKGQELSQIFPIVTPGKQGLGLEEHHFWRPDPHHRPSDVQGSTTGMNPKFSFLFFSLSLRNIY